MRTAGRPDSTCDAAAAQCVFHYVDSATPSLLSVFSRAGYPGDDLAVHGNFKMANTKLLKAVRIGEHFCDRFKETLNDDSDLNAFADNYLPCSLSPEIEGGFYNAEFSNHLGSAVKYADFSVAHPKRDGSEYNYQVVPLIHHVSSNVAGDKGQLLHIQG